MRRSSQIRYISVGPDGGGREPGVLARILGVIVAVVVLGVAVFLGAVFIAAIVGLVLIAGIGIYARAWWLRRKMERYQREHGDLNAEYTVVREEDHRE